jgi:Ala-tRNA(Pro) deacylase
MTHAHPSPCDRLLSFLHDRAVPFRLLEHPECRSADESTATRAAAGAPESVGAKALLIRTESGQLTVLVLPADRRLLSKAVRRRAGQFRFATPAELHEATGLEYGMVPPFGRPVFPAVSVLLVDEALLQAEVVGFNAASLTCSVVMACGDYVRVSRPDAVFAFSAGEPVLPAAAFGLGGGACLQAVGGGPAPARSRALAVARDVVELVARQRRRPHLVELDEIVRRHFGAGYYLGPSDGDEVLAVLAGARRPWPADDRLLTRALEETRALVFHHYPNALNVGLS